MMMILLAAGFAFLFIGASTLFASASSAQTRHASPNYYYLPDPKILTADTNNVYVINGEGAGRQLFAFNILGNWGEQPPSRSISPNVIFIKHAGNMIFLFEEDGFTAISYNNATRTFTSHSLIKQPYRSSGAVTTFQLFDVKALNANTYRIFFASTNISTPRYGWSDFTLSGTTAWARNEIYMTPSNFPESNSIKAIAADGTNTLYICALSLWDSDERYNIYEINLATTNNPTLLLPAVNGHPLSSFTSFAAVQGRGTFIYINNNKGLTLFDRSSSHDNPFVIQPDNAPPSAFTAAASRAPYFVATTNQNYAYVIDKEKLSIDRYIIRADSTLEFDEVIVAHLGGDRGFFNTPTSLTVINSAMRKGADMTSSEYLVTDRAGQVMYNRIDSAGKVTATPFFEDPSTRLSTFVRATYDNYDTVYIYDTAQQQNRVRAFSLNGKYKGQEFIGFGHVTHMFADATRTIYAIDAMQGKIHIFGANVERTFVALPTDYASANTKGIYSEQLNAIILANATDEILVLSLDGSSQILNFSEDVLDISTDALGNLVTLTEQASKFYVSLYEYTDPSFELTPEFRREITDATVARANPSLNLDRINRRILYIGARHAIESFELGTDLWSYTDHVYDDTWKDNTSALSMFNPAYETNPIIASNTTPVFLNAVNGAVIYAFPGGTRALAFVPKNSVLKVLKYTDLYVLYENPLTGEYVTGYVSPRTVSAAQPYSIPMFTFARVIFSYTIVYKYPTAERGSLDPSQSLALLTLPKNFELASNKIGGLQLLHKVNVLDVRGFTFYEIRMGKRANGTYYPASNNDDDGIYVGYINASNVIDYDLGPSTERFIPNATIRIPASHNLSNIQIFEKSESGILRELPNEFLKNKQQIRVLGRLNQNREYTYIHYYDTELGRLRPGWIKTEYIVMNGLSAVQLIAIAVLSLLAIGGVTGGIWFYKRRR